MHRVEIGKHFGIGLKGEASDECCLFTFAVAVGAVIVVLATRY